MSAVVANNSSGELEAICSFDNFEKSTFCNLNSRSGVWPMSAIALSISVTPGSSTMRRSSLLPEISPASSTWIIGSDTPNTFTRLSITSRSASIDVATSPGATLEISAL